MWTSNWLDVARRPVQLMLLTLMFATLLMATSVSAAFGAHVAGVDLGEDRAGLFVIGYLTIGKAFVDVPVEAGRLVALAFLGTVSLWWCYFHRAERVGIDAVRSAGDGSRLVAFGNYSLVAMVIGIIAIAVGDELAIAEPGYPLITTAMSALIFGGPAIFLLAQLAFFHQATGEVSQSRIVACVALALATSSFTLLAAVIAASLVLLGVAIADTQAEKPSTATL